MQLVDNRGGHVCATDVSTDDERMIAFPLLDPELEEALVCLAILQALLLQKRKGALGPGACGWEKGVMLTQLTPCTIS